jgi:hypothetical protein
LFFIPDTRGGVMTAKDQLIAALENLPESVLQETLNHVQCSKKAIDMDAEDQAWMNSDLSRLSEFEPYDWGEMDPATAGHPIVYEQVRGFVIVGLGDEE